LEAPTCVSVHFLPRSKSILKTEIEWQTKHRTTIGDVLPPTYWYGARNDSVREASTTGIALTEICSKLFIAIGVHELRKGGAWGKALGFGF